MSSDGRTMGHIKKIKIPLLVTHEFNALVIVLSESQSDLYLILIIFWLLLLVVLL